MSGQQKRVRSRTGSVDRGLEPGPSAAKERRNYPEEYVLTSQDVQDLRQLSERIAAAVEPHLVLTQQHVTETVTRLERSIQKGRQEDRDALDHMDDKLKELLSMKDTLKVREAEIKELKMVVTNKDTEIERLRRERDEKDQEVTRVKATYHQRVYASSSQPEVSRVSGRQTSTTLNYWKNKYEAENKELQRAREDLDKEMKELRQSKQEVSRLQKDLEHVRAQLQQRDQTIQSLNERISWLQNDLRIKEAESEVSRAEVQQVITQLLEKTQRLEHEAQHTSAVLDQKDQMLQKLGAEAQQMKAQLDERDQTIHRMEEEAKQVNAQLHQKDQTLQKIDTYNREWMQYGKKVEEDKRRYDESLKYYEQRLHKTQEELKAAKAVRSGANHTGRSAAEDLRIQQGGDHDDLLQEMEEAFTDEVLGTLEQYLEHHEAKVLLCEAFQQSYDSARDTVINMVVAQMKKLFEKSGPSPAMDFTSRAFGMLLHATEARSEGVREEAIRGITATVLDGLRSSELFVKFATKLATKTSGSKKELRSTIDQVVHLAWKLVTLPCPIIVCQPKSLDETCMDKETYHWNPKAKDYRLVYTESVVYRSYHGTMLARKGTVGNTSDRTVPSQTLPVDHSKSCVIA